MKWDEILRLPSVAEALQILHPTESVCGICHLPWSISGAKYISTSSEGGVFYVCPYCFKHSSLEQVLNATVEGYMKQYENVHEEYGREFRKKYDLLKILRETAREYTEIHETNEL